MTQSRKPKGAPESSGGQFTGRTRVAVTDSALIDSNTRIQQTVSLAQAAWQNMIDARDEYISLQIQAIRLRFAQDFPEGSVVMAKWHNDNGNEYISLNGVRLHTGETIELDYNSHEEYDYDELDQYVIEANYPGMEVDELERVGGYKENQWVYNRDTHTYETKI